MLPTTPVSMWLSISGLPTLFEQWKLVICECMAGSMALGFLIDMDNCSRLSGLVALLINRCGNVPLTSINDAMCSIDILSDSLYLLLMFSWVQSNTLANVNVQYPLSIIICSYSRCLPHRSLLSCQDLIYRNQTECIIRQLSSMVSYVVPGRQPSNCRFIYFKKHMDAGNSNVLAEPRVTAALHVFFCSSLVLFGC